MSIKNKVDFDDYGDPAGLGDDIEEVKNLNIFEFLQDTAAFKEVTKDLSENENIQVLKEAEIQAASYQKVFDHFSKILSTDEGKKKFEEMMRKKVYGR